MSALGLLGYTSRGNAQDSARPKTTKSTKARSAKPKVAKPKSDPVVEEPKWPVDGPPPLSGSILPQKRIVAFYGNPLQKRMGILGALPPNEMLAKLDREVAAWNAADSTMPVQPALHLIAVVAQDNPGTSGKYRMRMDSALIEKVYGWAQRKNALLFLDVQVGQGTHRARVNHVERLGEASYVYLDVKGAATPLLAKTSRNDITIDEIVPFELPAGAIRLVKLLAAHDLAASVSDAQRQVQQGSVRLNGERVTDVKAEVSEPPGETVLIQVGKRKYLKVIFR